MMTLDSLRAELDAHAATVTEGEDTWARAAAVHQRIVGIRRRRRAVLAAGLATALVLGGGLTLLRSPKAPDPADRTLAGVLAPKRLVADGWTYEFDRGVDTRADRRLVLRLAATDQPRLVSWTAGPGATLQVPGDSWSSTGLAVPSRFADFEWVPPGEPARFVLADAARQPMAFAVYELSDTPPAGYTKDGITFRRDVGGAQLLGARLGDAGETTVTTPVVLPDGFFGQAFVCQSAIESAWVAYTLDGKVIGGSDCNGLDDAYDRFDPGAGGQFFVKPTIRVGSTVWRAGDEAVLGVRLQRGHDDPTPVVDPKATLGVAGYARQPAETLRLARGVQVDVVQSRVGHQWALSDVTVANPGDRSVTLRLPPRPGTISLEAVLWNSAEASSIGVRVDGRLVQETSFAVGGGPASFAAATLRPGRGHTVTLTWLDGTRRPDSVLALAAYERRD